MLLIPQYGLMGAAYATLASYLVMAVLMYLMVRKIYPVPYEWMRLTKIGGAAVAVYALTELVDAGTWTIAWRGGLLLCFPFLLYLLRFFVPGELPGVARLLRPVRPRATDTVVSSRGRRVMVFPSRIPYFVYL